jgi:hypothetical protein
MAVQAYGATGNGSTDSEAKTQCVDETSVDAMFDAANAHILSVRWLHSTEKMISFQIVFGIESLTLASSTVEQSD